MEEPFFSIIIPSYNRGHLIRNTLNSVLSQTFQDWECIFVDDGSTDNTNQVVDAIKDNRIGYFFKENAERSAARNFGIKQAKGKYLCFLDSDDVYYPNHLSSLYYRIRQEGCPIALFNTGIYECSDSRKIARPIYTREEYSHPIFFVWEKFMLPTSVCVHRDLFNIHMFPEDFNVWEDTHLWLRLLAQNEFYQLSEVTAQWNIHKEGSVAKAFNLIESSRVKIYLRCISHLFHNHKKLLEPFLGQKEKKDYQLKKLKLFMGLAFKRHQYTVVLDLYLFGLKEVEKKRLSKFFFRLIAGRIQSTIKVLSKNR